MKKIVVAMAIAVMAVAAQAASINWSLNNIQASPSVSDTAGWLVQVYEASTTFSYDAAKAGSITAVSSGASALSGTIYKASGSTADSYAAGSTTSFYAVLFDASSVADAQNYIISSTKAVTIAASGANASLAFGNMAGTTTTNMFLNSSWAATGNTPGGAPEPTSGLLVILGMAGLALKRKVA